MRKLLFFSLLLCATTHTAYAQIFAKTYNSLTQVDGQTGIETTYKGQTVVKVYQNGINLNGTALDATVKEMGENTFVFESLTGAFRGTILNGVLSIQFFYNDETANKGLKMVYR